MISGKLGEGGWEAQATGIPCVCTAWALDSAERTQLPPHLFQDLLILYLKSRSADREERQGEIFQQTAVVAKAKQVETPEPGSSSRSPSAPKIWAIFLCFPAQTSRKLDQKWNRWNSNQCPTGCQCRNRRQSLTLQWHGVSTAASSLLCYM